MPYSTADEVIEDRRRRLANQLAYRDCFVECVCEEGCLQCAYTGLISKGQARLALAPPAPEPDEDAPGPRRLPRFR